jgi:hypothetical protein
MRLVCGLVQWLLALAVAVPTFVLVFRHMDRVTPVWERASGRPVPAEFRYLMFPARPAEAILRDEAKGVTTILQRAVANTQEEVGAGGRVHVNGPRGEDLSVALSDLSFLPPSGSSIDYVGRWNEDLRQRGAQMRAGRFGVELVDGRRVVHLRFIDAMDDVRFEYETDGATATPLAMWKESVASGRDLFALAAAALAGLAAGSIVLAVTSRVYRVRTVGRR